MEVKNSSINKGKTCSRFLLDKNFDEIICIGDDYTDEYMFEELPNDTVTIKVGIKKTKAQYYLKTPESVRAFLKKLF